MNSYSLIHRKPQQIMIITSKIRFEVCKTIRYNHRFN